MGTTSIKMQEKPMTGMTMADEGAEHDTAGKDIGG